MMKMGEIDSVFRQTLSLQDFRRLGGLIESEYGIKMPDSKKDMLETRLRKRLRQLGFKTFSQYCDYLFTDKGMNDELMHMLDMVTTNKTDFFRGPDHFDLLVRQVLPDLISRKGAGINRNLMVWSAGCSTGEEPYTLAMVISEFQRRAPGLRINYTILGTDLSSRVLNASARAVYTEQKIEPVPMELKKRYMLKSKDPAKQLVRIVPELRNQVKFRRLNFLDEDFGMREPIDIVFYRNVMIYFKRDTQKMILKKIIAAIRPGGYLFIGHSETLTSLGLHVEQVAPTVYRIPE